MMRRDAPIVLTALALVASPSFAAAGSDLGALARPLVEDLSKPEFSQSRCMLAPLLADDKRTVAMSRDDTFHPGDRILAINGEPLSATNNRGLHDILIRYAPDAAVTVRLLRAGSETDVTAPCSDSQTYYALLRAAATAAVLDDAATCADRMAEVGKQHALASTWLNVSLNCSIKAGRVSGAPMLAEYFVVFHEELLENEYSPDALQKVRPLLQGAAQIMLFSGSRPLAEKLQQEYASAVAKWAPLQGSGLALQLPAAPMASPSTGIVQVAPSVSITQDGKVTQMTVAGQLAAKRPVGCVPLAQVDTTRTPPDLYLGVTACIQQDAYRTAAGLFALAGVESQFDAQRVLDKSAGQAGQVLIMNTFNGLSDEKREKFGKAVTEFAADTTALAQACTGIRKMGYPSYYPEYMVLHGIHAFTAKPGDPTLVATFDAAATWNSLLTTYLNCHDAPAAPLSAANQAAPSSGGAPPVPGPPSTIKPDPPGLAACVFPKLTAWISSQHPQAPYPAMMAKKDELIAECSKQLHVDIAERCDTQGTESTLDQRRDANIPATCQSIVPGSDTVIIWHPVGDSIFEKQRPTDGRVQDGRLAVYQALLKPRVEQPRQGDPPDTLYALLYDNGSQRTLFPLNYTAEDPQHIQLPSRGPAQLAVAMDSHRHTYLLYAPSLSFLAPSWDSTQPSLERFYVWWLDPQKKIVRRLLLPQGPWVDDAKLDKVLARDVRNFSCGTGCYRNYEVEADSGDIFFTISGRTSAVSEKILGTYKLGPDGTKWNKIRDGKPSE
jgi:hypothetical protein